MNRRGFFASVAAAAAGAVGGVLVGQAAGDVGHEYEGDCSYSLEPAGKCECVCGGAMFQPFNAQVLTHDIDGNERWVDIDLRFEPAEDRAAGA